MEQFHFLICTGVLLVGVVNSGTSDVTYDLLGAQSSTGSFGGGLFLTPQVSMQPGAVGFSWSSTPGQTFTVQYTLSLPPTWIDSTNAVVETNGQYHFLDNEAQTGPVNFKLYRLRLAP